MGPASVNLLRQQWSIWFPALVERNVRVYVFGQSVSIMGTWVLDIMLNLVLWGMTRSPALLGLLNFLLYVPGLLITPMFAAGLTQANARRRTLWVLAGGLAVAMALAVFSGLDRLSTTVLLSLAVARGVLNGMEQPARQMLLATSVSHPERIGGAVALNTVVYQVARMTGPALAALIYSTVGAGWGFVFSAAALVVMVGCVLRVRAEAGAHAAPPAEGRQGLRGALDFVRRDRFGSLFLPVVSCMAAFVGGYQTLVPVLADRVYADTARYTSLFFGAAGAGALTAALVLSTGMLDGALRRLPVPVPWLVALALLGLGTSTWVPLTLLCFGMVGFGMTMLSTGTSAMLHRTVPPQARNGLIALILVAFNGVIPIAQLVAGLLSEWMGVQRSFLALGGVLLVVLAMLFGRRWRVLGRVELDAERL